MPRLLELLGLGCVEREQGQARRVDAPRDVRHAVVERVALGQAIARGREVAP